MEGSAICDQQGFRREEQDIDQLFLSISGNFYDHPFDHAAGRCVCAP
jgi:hypothetical protein